MVNNILKYLVPGILGLLIFNFFTGGVLINSFRAAIEGKDQLAVYSGKEKLRQNPFSDSFVNKNLALNQRVLGKPGYGTASTLDYLTFALKTVGVIIFTLSWICLVVAGFFETVGWGLGALFIPFVAIIFGLMHFEKPLAKVGVLLTLASIIVLGISAGLVSLS